MSSCTICRQKWQKHLGRSVTISVDQSLPSKPRLITTGSLNSVARIAIAEYFLCGLRYQNAQVTTKRKKIWPIWTPKSENGSDGNNGETTRCNLRLGLIITPHRNRNNTNRYISTDFGQIRSELIESSIKGFQFLTSTVKASKQTRFYRKNCFWLATVSS